MSFPNLIISGTTDPYVINQIAVQYDNDGAVFTKPAYITRLSYDIRRQTNNLNVSGGTAKRYFDVPYNAVRFVHTWVGYIDCLTDSVSIRTGSTAATQMTVNMIKQAALMNITDGIEWTLPVPATLGPDEPSNDAVYNKGKEVSTGWVYKMTSNGATPPVYSRSTTTWWVVKDINIQDNQNNSSRVTFTFEYITLWQSLEDIIEA